MEQPRQKKRKAHPPTQFVRAAFGASSPFLSLCVLFVVRSLPCKKGPPTKSRFAIENVTQQTNSNHPHHDGTHHTKARAGTRRHTTQNTTVRKGGNTGECVRVYHGVSWEQWCGRTIQPTNQWTHTNTQRNMKVETRRERRHISI